MESRIPVCLSIGGSDSCGGAGIQTDLRSIEACGIRACTAITALTAQNPAGVTRIEISPQAQVEAEIRAIFDYYDVRAVKTGMLAQANTVSLVADLMEELHPTGRLVADPVMIATSGATLLQTVAIKQLETRLFPLASLITPNLPESRALLAEYPDDQEEAVQALYARYQRPVLLKGGHGSGDEISDLLFDGQRVTRFTHHRQAWGVEQSHGSGCRLASSIAAHLAIGYELTEAVGHAIEHLFPD
ncbi:MAG TPA: bifunctional hydroxymethylpyrimidine kinase/phosphomethylpyrimidine kinase [Mariprofundaceae bacterium]|nr:bifunctional hydroxymethylpyrimidine kinase/phosphomethylpyrimidine kinase [Mariprofundaceae bacterium]